MGGRGKRSEVVIQEKPIWRSLAWKWMDANAFVVGFLKALDESDDCR